VFITLPKESNDLLKYTMIFLQISNKKKYGSTTFYLFTKCNVSSFRWGGQFAEET
jgi:hypothetical protein